MKKLLMLPLLALLVSFPMHSTAQKANETPTFDNAKVSAVLKWAQNDLGVGFVYEGADLVDPKTNKERTVSSQGITPKTRAQKTLLLFELLKRAGLVPFEVGGLPGPTYHLYTAKSALRNAEILNHVDDLGDRWFASLSIRVQRATVETLAKDIREILTDGVGKVEVFATTHTLVVSDYCDRLRAAWELAMQADIKSVRDDDPVIYDHVSKQMPAEQMVASLERLRASGESWRASVNSSSNVVLLTGRRDEIELLKIRILRLEAHPPKKQYKEQTFTLRALYVSSSEAAKTLKELFVREIKLGSVRIGSFERTRSIVFTGSRLDYDRAVDAMKIIDSKPEDKSGVKEK